MAQNQERPDEEVQYKRFESQFEVSIRLLRRFLQEDLLQLLGKDRSVLNTYLMALDIDEARRDVRIKGERNPVWKWDKQGAYWKFLPRAFGEDGPTYREGDDLATLVASLFGLWVYFFDPAQGTYYYPFDQKNLVFGSKNGEEWFRLKGECQEGEYPYQKCLENLLKDYRLTIGEGSQGLAAHGARGVFLPNTFMDIRGAVALEDLFLRNASYMSFPIFPVKPASSPATSRDGRLSGEAPFAYLAMTFPVPLPLDPSSSTDPGSMFKLYDDLRKDFVVSKATPILGACQGL